VSNRRLFTRIFSALAAAALLSACHGGSTNAPPVPALSAGTQSALRATESHHGTPAIVANPASLQFTGAQAAAGTPQTVIVSAKSGDKRSVSIAGTGNCPLVSPSQLKPKAMDEDGDRDHDRGDTKAGVVTVTPHGAGPATCIITVSSAHGAGHDGDRDRDRHDGDRHDGDGHDHDRDDASALTIPVTVDASATPSPTPSPSPTPCTSRIC
jgi:hypothetical protein